VQLRRISLPRDLGSWELVLNIPALSRAVAVLLLASWLLAAPARALEPARLDFQIQEGLNLNRLVREGEVAQAAIPAS
jgi:hypothetical protein